MNEQKPLDQSVLPAVALLGSIALAFVLIFAAQPPTAQNPPSPTTQAEAAIEVTATPEPAVAAAPTEAPAMAHDMGAGDPVVLGEQIYQRTCTACHGFDAKGIQGLGKTLVGSVFIDGLTDDELAAFIAQGRDVTDPQNTTGVAMPPRGGNPALTDEDLAHVVAYIRSLNAAQTAAAPTAQVTAAPIESEPWVPADINALDSAAVPPSFGSSGALNLDLSDGHSIYLWACAACHGAEGSGVENFGPALTQGALDAGQVRQLLTSPNLSDGSFAHAYRGGYPELSDDQLAALIDYLGTLE